MIKRKNNLAYTLIELMLTLGLITTLSALVFATYTKKTEEQKARTQASVIADLSTSINNYAASSTPASFETNFDNSAIITNSMIAQEYINGTNLTNVFGGVLSASVVDIFSSKGYSIDLTAIPSYACTYLATQVGYKSDAVSVNATVLKAAGSTADIDVSAAAGLCANDLNTISFRKAVLRENLTLANNSTGNDGVNNPYLVADLHQTTYGAGFLGCPAGTSDTGYGCACPEGEIWVGDRCEVISARYRLDGVTLGSAVPTTPTSSAGISSLLAATTVGTPATYNPELSAYIPSYITLPSSSTPGTYGRVITQSSTGGSSGNYLSPTAAAMGSCTNGLVWSSSLNACTQPSFTYFNGVGDTTVAIDAAYDNNKFKTCLLGTRDNGKCIMPSNTSTNTPTTLWQSTVTEQVGRGRCTNGKIWSEATQSCACSSNTVLDSGICKCSAGTTFDATTQSCI